MTTALPRSSVNSVAQMRQAAEAAWKRRDYQLSIKILERASRSAPADVRLLLHLGRCHGLCYHYAAARRCFERIISATGQKNESFVAVGLQYLSFGQHEMAACCFERALKRNGDSLEVLVRLAEVRERQNRSDEAADLVERALKLDSHFAPALLTRARLHRSGGRLETAEALLRSFVSQPKSHSLLRAQAWYEFGTVLDRQQRFEEALSAFLQAKSLAPATAAQEASRQAAQAVLKQTEETISSGLLQRWRAFDKAFEPPRQLAILCGHPRSGTTLLEQVLDAHPGIVSVEETGIFFEEAFLPLGRSQQQSHFVPVLDALPAHRLRQSREDYFCCVDRFLGQPVGKRLLIDKNPSLTSLIPAVIRVFPEAKFLVALRDPRDVCLSCFMQPLFPTNRISSTYQTLEATVSDYALTMGFWQALKPIMPNPFLEVRYEDLVDDLESVARRTLEFLEVPWDDRVLDFQKHTRNKLVRSPTYAEVRKPVTNRAIGRWRNYEEYLEPYLPVLEPFVKAFGYE
jgi:tetratricopeptide (TPR) repeat protein